MTAAKRTREESDRELTQSEQEKEQREAEEEAAADASIDDEYVEVKEAKARKGEKKRNGRIPES